PVSVEIRPLIARFPRGIADDDHRGGTVAGAFGFLVNGGDRSLYDILVGPRGVIDGGHGRLWIVALVEKSVHRLAHGVGSEIDAGCHVAHPDELADVILLGV